MIARLVTLLVLLAAPARADVTIGLYAPTAPFEGSGDRVSFVNAIADHLASVAGDKVTGKVFGSASAFAAAVKKGEIQFAIVDAPYAAANGLPYTMLAAATRGGAAHASWQLIAKSSAGTIRTLRGARVAIPTVGARVQSFVGNALLGGEVDATYFGGITEAADARSAATMITVGKVDAAFVPAGVDPPSGTKRVATLSAVGWPMFVALPSADSKLVTAFSTKIKSFSGAAGFGAFTDAGSGNYRTLMLAFGKSAKRGPLAVPSASRLGVKELLAGRVFEPPLTDVLDAVEPP